MQLIVLSAGRGSRLPNKFRNKPKCLVELNSQPLITYNTNFFKHFKNKIIVTGYKYSYLKEIASMNGFKQIFNKYYLTTNMVYSLFLARQFIKQDVVVVYGDVIFNENIYKIINQNDNIIPVNVNWLKNWKSRMPLNQILKDAENLIVKNNTLLEIGNEIDKKSMPKYQFMGIIKLKKKAFFNCYDFFNKLNNKKIDMTSFINLCIKNKIVSFKVEKYKSYWYEIDTISDHKFAERDIKKW